MQLYPGKLCGLPSTEQTLRIGGTALLECWYHASIPATPRVSRKLQKRQTTATVSATLSSEESLKVREPRSPNPPVQSDVPQTYVWWGSHHSTRTILEDLGLLIVATSNCDLPYSLNRTRARTQIALLQPGALWTRTP